jgi:hypothetical protein
MLEQRLEASRKRRLNITGGNLFPNLFQINERRYVFYS